MVTTDSKLSLFPTSTQLPITLWRSKYGAVVTLVFSIAIRLWKLCLLPISLRISKTAVSVKPNSSARTTISFWCNSLAMCLFSSTLKRVWLIKRLSAKAKWRYTTRWLSPTSERLSTYCLHASNIAMPIKVALPKALQRVCSPKYTSLWADIAKLLRCATLSKISVIPSILIIPIVLALPNATKTLPSLSLKFSTTDLPKTISGAKKTKPLGSVPLWVLATAVG